LILKTEHSPGGIEKLMLNKCCGGIGAINSSLLILTLELFDFSTVDFALRVAGQALFSRFQKFFAPAVVQFSRHSLSLPSASPFLLEPLLAKKVSLIFPPLFA
jgi:hypothetical protein